MIIRVPYYLLRDLARREHLHKRITSRKSLRLISSLFWRILGPIHMP
jgi:hypothetical protein